MQTPVIYVRNKHSHTRIFHTLTHTASKQEYMYTTTNNCAQLTTPVQITIVSVPVTFRFSTQQI